MKAYKNILFSKEKNYYMVKINRPDHLNALNQNTIDELKECFKFIKNNSINIFGVIITGSGEKAFVAGADIKEFTKLDEKLSIEFAKNGHVLFDMIEDMQIPVIALVNGYALGGGCELSLACHLRIATSNAKFSQPEVNLGLIPGFGGTQRLTQLIGKTKALELMMTAEMISSESALGLGLVNYVLSNKEKGILKCEELINIFKRKSPIAIKNVIKSVNSFYDNNINGFNREIQLFSECANTNDFKEGVQSFIEKRCPDFKGD
jgi:enoyl-CoA hydratase|tara:strand:+ start:883 stop:1671 length:789 start_codon:yes stop_codon:yes gene_type:complete